MMRDCPVAFYNNPETGFMEFTQLTMDDPTEDDVAAEMERLGRPYDGISPMSIIPQDEVSAVFSDAMVYSAGAITYSLPRAVEIKMTMLRKMREQLFPGLDVRRARAMENDDKEEMKNVREQSEALRNMPATARGVLENAGDIQAIYAYVPDIITDLLTQ